MVSRTMSHINHQSLKYCLIVSPCMQSRGARSRTRSNLPTVNLRNVPVTVQICLRIHLIDRHPHTSPCPLLYTHTLLPSRRTLLVLLGAQHSTHTLSFDSLDQVSTRPTHYPTTRPILTTHATTRRYLLFILHTVYPVFIPSSSPLYLVRLLSHHSFSSDHPPLSSSSLFSSLHLHLFPPLSSRNR
jgi:hypothetical protein